ncbi:MAG TPA: tRNA (adenosine(37)-N6)-threonylcarbamoyltransferase complex dimerization subunit type 1 TsaB [Candidatus Binatia bacterium]|nr:tRNA (adenosine(37)-N6)-threonylcarbamoyltransferase complex dimerization subunit type 1 TsaB [Candidatus Binatia bacterium]
MRIVGIDTSSATASVALLEDGQLIAERCHPGAIAGHAAGLAGFKSNHAETLLPLIDSVVRQARVSLPEVSGIALSIGPGSFTGLRIGLSTVKGLAYGWGIPVVGVSTLLAHAARIGDPSLGIPPENRGVVLSERSESKDDGNSQPGLHGGLHFDGVICVLLDARKHEVYAALFRKSKHGLTRLTEDCLALVEDVIGQMRSRIGSMPGIFIGDAIDRYGKRLLDSLGSDVRLCTGNFVSSCAAAVARLGMERFRNSESDELGNLVPVYLRPSEAEAKRSNLTDGKFANSTLRTLRYVDKNTTVR